MLNLDILGLNILKNIDVKIAGNRSIFCKCHDFRLEYINRGDRIRTCDLLVPNQAL